MHCARLANIEFGTSVLVLGAGPIGILCGVVARAFGVCIVAVIDIIDARLEFARSYAVTATYKMEPVSPEESALQIMAAADIDQGADVVIDATGAQVFTSTGIYAMKKGGAFAQAGLGAPSIQFPVAQLCSKEGVYRGSFRYGPGDHKTAIELMTQQRVTLKELIAHRYAFTEAEIAFEHSRVWSSVKASRPLSTARA